jgi:hypothetical protein
MMACSGTIRKEIPAPGRTTVLSRTAVAELVDAQRMDMPHRGMTGH